MARYLVVAHQTVGRPELLDRLKAIAGDDTTAWFTVLVPATDPSHLLVWEAGDARDIAQRKAQTARDVLSQAKLHVTRTAVGDASPVVAIEEELRAHPGAHASVILCTLPAGVSRWLGLNVVEEAVERLKLPIEHVVAGDVYDATLDSLANPGPGEPGIAY